MVARTDRSTRIMLIGVVSWTVVSLAGLAVALARMQIDRTPTPDASAANLSYLRLFWITGASGWLALTALWLLMRRHGDEGRVSLPPRLVLGVAAAARLAVVATHQPALSDDLHRYVLDGRNLAHGVNPYIESPAERITALTETTDPQERWHGEQALLDRVNNPTLHTIYLPTSQWFFATVGLAAEAIPGGGRVMRAALSGLDLAVIALLLVALHRAGRPAWWAALYAWHPLPVTEIAASGHQESLGIVLLVAALLLGTSAIRRDGTWTVALAAGALVKPVVLPTAAFLLKGERWKTWAVSAAIGVVACLVIGAPLLLTHGGEPLENLMATGERFRLKWAHFGSVYEPVLWAIEKLRPEWINDRHEVLARRVCLALLGIVVLVTWLRQPRDRSAAWASTRTVLFAMVLLSPAAHPWYLLWALACLPMAPSAAVWVASLTLPLGYAVLGSVETWQVSPWLMVAAYAPVYGALVYAAWSRGDATTMLRPCALAR